MSLDFEVVHIRGINNTRPDALSRLQISAISSVNQVGLSHEQLVRDKQCPETQEERRNMIETEHTRGHFGAQAMFMRIWHNGFWWPQIRNQIKEMIAHCVPCQRVEVQRQGYHPLQSITAAKPMDQVQVDLIVGVPRSEEGFNAIPVLKDIHTGYLWLHPLTTRGAAEVAEALMKIIRQFGPMMVKITEYAKVEHRFGSSSVGHPSSRHRPAGHPSS
jgi:hypothetical protein